MPGYCGLIRCAEFIHGGVGVQINLSKGFASSFLTFVVRGGIRSDALYGQQYEFEFSSMAPFADCFNKKIWDLGVSAGYGFHTPIGDLIFGVGFNKDMQLALYLELE